MGISQTLKLSSEELPQITVRLEEGHTTYRFTGSFDGKHTLSEKAVKLVDEQKGV